MKYILALLPALAVLCIFRFFGTMWGIIGLVVYLAAAIFIKLPDYLMIAAGGQYKKDPKKALQTMEKALRTKRLRTDYLLYYSFVCLKCGETEKAGTLLDMAATRKLSPEQLCRLSVNRALFEWKSGNIEKAISILEEQQKLGKDKAVYGTLGQLLLLNGQLQRALELNEEAFAFDKYDESITDNLALTYRMTGDIDSSAALYKTLTDKKLGVPLPYYNYGETLYMMGRKEEAAEMMEKALTYPFSALAAVSKEEVRSRIRAIEAELGNTDE